MKRCTLCGETKPLDAFYTNRDNLGRSCLRSQCKECVCAKRRKPAKEQPQAQPGNKICGVCAHEKSLEAFYHHGTSPDKRRPRCKECEQEHGRTLRRKARIERERATAGRKRCPRCVRTLPVSHFGTRSNNPNWLRSYCHACEQVVWRGYMNSIGDERRQHSQKDRYLRAKYGIGLDDYEAMLKAQGGGCAICGRRNNGERALAVDHNHVTAKVRGILCTRCNSALGVFHDDHHLLRRAADYLVRTAG